MLHQPECVSLCVPLEMLVYFIQRPEGEFTEKTKLCQQGKQQQKQKKAIMWVSVERKENCYFIWKAKMLLGSL